MSSFNADQLKELENFFDDRYVMQSDCNERQQGIDKKFANDDKRIEIITHEFGIIKKFLWVLVSSSVGMLLTETVSLDALLVCIGPILYVGLFSSGVAYTLQILAQKDSDPTVVSLLLSLESVFATLAGAVILHDQMSGKEYLGCVLMLCAVVLAQLPEKKKIEA